MTLEHTEKTIKETKTKAQEEAQTVKVKEEKTPNTKEKGMKKSITVVNHQEVKQVQIVYILMIVNMQQHMQVNPAALLKGIKEIKNIMIH